MKMWKNGRSGIIRIHRYTHKAKSKTTGKIFFFFSFSPTGNLKPAKLILPHRWRRLRKKRRRRIKCVQEGKKKKSKVREGRLNAQSFLLYICTDIYWQKAVAAKIKLPADEGINNRAPMCFRAQCTGKLFATATAPLSRVKYSTETVHNVQCRSIRIIVVFFSVSLSLIFWGLYVCIMQVWRAFVRR